MKQANSIFKLMIGASVLILSVSVLFYTAKSANAEQRINTSNMMPAGVSGKYMIQYVANVDGEGAFFWQMVIWDTETGNYKAYRWDRDAQDWKALFNNCKAFPAIP